MNKKLVNKKKFPSMSLVEYWYLSLKKDMKLKKLNLSLNKSLKNRKKFTHKNLNKKFLFVERNLIFSVNKKIFYNSFKNWIIKKYKDFFIKNLNLNRKKFIIKKLSKFKKYFYYKKFKNYNRFFKFLKNSKIRTYYNRLFYLNNLYIFSKFLKLNDFQLTKNYKFLNIMFLYNFLNYKDYKKFKKIKNKFMKRKFLVKWWYFLRCKISKLSKLKNLSLQCSINFNKGFFIKKNIIKFNNNKLMFIKFFKRFFKKLSKKSLVLVNDLKNSLYFLKKNEFIIFYYILFILKFFVKFSYTKVYYYYTLVKFLLSCNYEVLKNYLSILNFDQLLRKNFIKKVQKKFLGRKNLNLLFEKKWSILNLRISKNKLFKFNFLFFSNPLKMKIGLNFYNNYLKLGKNLNLSYDQLKKTKIFSFKFNLLNFKDDLSVNFFNGFKLNSNFFETNLNNFERKINNCYISILNFFVELKLKYNNVYINTNYFIKDCLLLFSFKKSLIIKLFFKFILTNKKLLKILMLSFNSFGIFFNILLKLLVKKFLLNIKSFFKLNKTSIINFNKNLLLNKFNWKNKLNIKQILQLNLFSMNNFYIKYFSLYKFIQNEKVNLIEGFYKIKNIYKIYKHVNPAKTLILDYSRDRKLFCLIWNIWESYYFYRDILVNYLKTEKFNQNKNIELNYLKTEKFNPMSVFFKRIRDKKYRNRELSFEEKLFNFKSKKVLSFLFMRKKFSFFNMLLFWYLLYFNKIFFFIKLVLFRLWIQYYFFFNKLDFDLLFLFKFNVNNVFLNHLHYTLIDLNFKNSFQKIKFYKNFSLRLFKFNFILKNHFIDFYRSINIYNDFFFKSFVESAIIQLNFISVSTIRKLENKNFNNFYLSFFKL